MYSCMECPYCVIDNDGEEICTTAGSCVKALQEEEY